MSTMDINIEDTVSVVEATPEAVVEATPEAVVEATPEENIKLDVVETPSKSQVLQFSDGLPLPFYLPKPYTQAPPHRNIPHPVKPQRVYNPKQTVAPPQKAVPPPTPSLRHRFSMPGFSFMRS